MMKLFSKILDAFFVRFCVMCGRSVNFLADTAVCKRCRPSIKEYGIEVYSKGRTFEKAIGALPYSGHCEKSLKKFKFKSIKYLGYTFAKIMHEKSAEVLGDIDIITCVPMGKRGRDYNQAGVLAGELSALSGHECITDMLIKVKDIPPLSSMGFRDRQNAVKGAYAFIDRYRVKGKNIALIDDVYTTGATSNECSKMLKMYGAKKVYILTACYATYHKKQ